MDNKLLKKLPSELFSKIYEYIYKETPGYMAIREEIHFYNKHVVEFCEKHENDLSIVEYTREEEESEELFITSLEFKKKDTDDTFVDWYFNELFLHNIILKQDRYYNSSEFLRELFLIEDDQYEYYR